MRIISWNVNGLRACAKKGFHGWLGACGADIVALQEVRAPVDEARALVAQTDGWNSHFVAGIRPGYSGVGLLSRTAPAEVHVGLGDPRFDDEGRLHMVRIGKLWVVNGYFPNGNGTPLPGGKRSNDRIPYKLDFYRALFERLADLKAGGAPILVVGDFNTAHREIDLARPRDNRETSGFRPEERAELDRWLGGGWVDTFRHFHPDTEGCYTWWSQRFGVRERNIGWRIDLALASPGAVPLLSGAAIHADVTGSDHCPISVDLGSKVLDGEPDFC